VAIANESATVAGVFNSVQDAQEAVRHLENQGFGKEEVSLVCNRDATGYDRLSAADKSELSDKTSDVIADAGIGAAIGGVGGLLLSIAGVAIPGIGPVLAAGPIVSALTGAGIGAAGGGLIGALTESGIPEEHAHYYSEAVRRGDVLVTVRASGDRADRASDILDQHGAVDVDERARNWRDRGWTGQHDTKAEPYTREQLERERSFYGSTMAGATSYMDDNAHTARTMDSMDDRQEDTGPGSSYAHTGDFEGTRPGQEGTWSRDTERGGAVGLGRDPLGRDTSHETRAGGRMDEARRRSRVYR
jgi:hypothetical protein